MNSVGNNIWKSLQKRQEAMARHIARKKVFLNAREKTRKDIEEATTIWKRTLEQLPNQEFN